MPLSLHVMVSVRAFKKVLVSNQFQLFLQVQELAPDLEVEGEMQALTALNKVRGLTHQAI